jgi:hypothetical protein
VVETQRVAASWYGNGELMTEEQILSSK